MPYVTVEKESGEDIDIYYQDWGKDSSLSSVTAGHSQRMTGMRSYYSFSITGIASSSMIAAATAAHANGRGTTTGIIMPTIFPP